MWERHLSWCLDESLSSNVREMWCDVMGERRLSRCLDESLSLGVEMMYIETFHWDIARERHMPLDLSFDVSHVSHVSRHWCPLRHFIETSHSRERHVRSQWRDIQKERHSDISLRRNETCHCVPRRDIETSQKRDTCLSISHLTCLMCQDIDVWRETSHWDITRERDVRWDMNGLINTEIVSHVRHQCLDVSPSPEMSQCPHKHRDCETWMSWRVSPLRCLNVSHMRHEYLDKHRDCVSHWCLIRHDIKSFMWDTFIHVSCLMSHVSSDMNDLMCLSLEMSQCVSRQTSMSWHVRHMRHVKWEIERHVSLSCDVSMSLLGT